MLTENKKEVVEESAASEEPQTTTKAMIVERIHEKTGMKRQQAKKIVDEFFEIIIEQLVEGNNVKIPGLGLFVIREKNERPGRNLKTGETVMIPPRRVVAFRSSARLRERLREEESEE